MTSHGPRPSHRRHRRNREKQAKTRLYLPRTLILFETNEVSGIPARSGRSRLVQKSRPPCRMRWSRAVLKTVDCSRDTTRSRSGDMSGRSSAAPCEGARTAWLSQYQGTGRPLRLMGGKCRNGIPGYTLHKTTGFMRIRRLSAPRSPRSHRRRAPRAAHWSDAGHPGVR